MLVNIRLEMRLVNKSTVDLQEQGALPGGGSTGFVSLDKSCVGCLAFIPAAAPAPVGAPHTTELPQATEIQQRNLSAALGWPFLGEDDDPEEPQGWLETSAHQRG